MTFKTDKHVIARITTWTQTINVVNELCLSLNYIGLMSNILVKLILYYLLQQIIKLKIV